MRLGVLRSGALRGATTAGAAIVMARGPISLSQRRGGAEKYAKKMNVQYGNPWRYILKSLQFSLHFGQMGGLSPSTTLDLSW